MEKSKYKMLSEEDRKIYKDKCNLRVKTKYASFNKEEKKEYMAKQKLWRDKNLGRYRLLTAKHRAKAKGLEFTISKEEMNDIWIKQDGKCYYSKIPMSRLENDIHVFSIERLDSNKGYIKDNVVLCSSTVNYMKNDLPLDKFIELVKQIAKNN